MHIDISGILQALNGIQIDDSKLDFVPIGGNYRVSAEKLTEHLITSENPDEVKAGNLIQNELKLDVTGFIIIPKELCKTGF